MNYNLLPLILNAKFKEEGVNKFLKKISISKEDLLNTIQTQLDNDPNKDKILRNIDYIKKKYRFK